MRRRRRSKKFRRVKKTILLLFIVIGFTFIITRMYFRPPTLMYAANKAHYYASIVVNDAISNQIVPNIDTNKLVHMRTRSNGQVSSVVLNMYEVNRLLTVLTKDIQDNLNQYEDDDTHVLNTMTLPLGVMFDHPLLSNIGPDIEINLKMIGTVQTDIISNVRPYGINNSLVEVVIRTEVKFEVLIPFQRTSIKVVTNTPLFMEIIQGQVPDYYYSGGSGSFVRPPSTSPDDEYDFEETPEDPGENS